MIARFTLKANEVDANTIEIWNEHADQNHLVATFNIDMLYMQPDFSVVFLDRLTRGNPIDIAWSEVGGDICHQRDVIVGTYGGLNFCHGCAMERTEEMTHDATDEVDHD